VFTNFSLILKVYVNCGILHRDCKVSFTLNQSPVTN